jgi:hypothetical protein
LCFKVFDNVNGELRSVIAPPEFSPNYRPGAWSSAKVGKIFVFEDLQSAHSFCSHAMGIAYVRSPQIWWVHAEEVDHIETIIPGCRAYINSSSLDRFWRAGRPTKIVPPEGTLVAFRIQPIARIEIWFQ